MSSHTESNGPLGSTTFITKQVKIRKPARANKGGVSAANSAKPVSAHNSDDRHRVPGKRWYLRSPWQPRKPLVITIRYRGGSQCWFEIHARGSMGRFVGSAVLIDVMREIWNDNPWPGDDA